MQSTPSYIKPARRRRAKLLAAANAARLPENLDSLSSEDLRVQLQKLHVYQNELVMQSEELCRAQLALNATRTRFFDLYDMSPSGYCTLNEQGVVLQSNRTAATMLGLPRQDLTGQPLYRFISRADQENISLHGRQLIEIGGVQSCELRMARRDGTLFWVQLSTIATREESGALTLRIVMSDIHERRQAEEEIRIAAAAFESQEGIFVTDVAGVILRVNRAFTEITGYTANEAVGQTPRLLNSGRHNADYYAAIWLSIASTGAWQGEIWDRRKSGEVFPASLTITAVKGKLAPATHYVASFIDITARKLAEDQLARLAFYDTLTHLPNRRLLMDRLKQALTSRERHHCQGALILVDLDDFKVVNDTLGHDQGDLLLEQVATRLSACIREGDTAARLGGDEFVVMLENLSESKSDAAREAQAVGEKIKAALNLPFQLKFHEHCSTASIGVTLFADELVSADELLKRADLAMYQAKATGRNSLRFFDPQMQAASTARAALDRGLRRALQNGEFLLHYQAQVAGLGHLTGVEALVRWQHPQRGMVWPAEFIPLAEDTRLILPLGQWVLETACLQLAAWALQPEMAHLTISVNVSARQFHQRNFVDQVLSALTLGGANPQLLKLELTESLLIDNLEDVIAKMSVLKAQGVGFSLDDFGTGYSSLSYLKQLPFDQLKIDQSFVRDLMTDTHDAVVARTIVALGHGLGLQVIAEGVETAEQFDFLASIGCDAYQGYHFGRPLPANAFTDLASDARSS